MKIGIIHFHFVSSFYNKRKNKHDNSILCGVRKVIEQRDVYGMWHILHLFLKIAQ